MSVFAARLRESSGAMNDAFGERTVDADADSIHEYRPKDGVKSAVEDVFWTERPFDGRHEQDNDGNTAQPRTATASVPAGNYNIRGHWFRDGEQWLITAVGGETAGRQQIELEKPQMKRQTTRRNA